MPKFGKLFMDQLLLCAQNLFGEHHPVQPALVMLIYKTLLRWNIKCILFSGINEVKQHTHFNITVLYHRNMCQNFRRGLRWLQNALICKCFLSIDFIMCISCVCFCAKRYIYGAIKRLSSYICYYSNKSVRNQDNKCLKRKATLPPWCKSLTVL